MHTSACINPSKEEARNIIAQLGATGTPPQHGVFHFTVGLSQYLELLKKEYLESFIKWGGSSFKLVVGSYGGGKTHFLYCVRELAWNEGYLTSYICLSPGECPLSRLELVYKSIVANLSTRAHIGIEAVLRAWVQEYMKRMEKNTLLDWIEGMSSTESSSFTNAAYGALKALIHGKEDDFQILLQWLKGEEIERQKGFKYGVTERLDKSSASRLMRSLSQFVKSIGYTGLILLFDEAERSLSVVTTREKRIVLDNLRQIVDECGNNRLPSCMIFYAVPDEHQLLDERFQVYEALRQRLSGTLSRFNPSGVKIDLEKIGGEPILFLQELGRKLCSIYQIAYHPIKFDERLLERMIDSFAQEAFAQRYADIGYRRIFVKSLIHGLHILREEPEHKMMKAEVSFIVKGELKNLKEERERVLEEEF